MTPIRDDNGRIIGASKIARDTSPPNAAPSARSRTTAEKVGELSHALDLAPAMVRGLDGRIFWGKGLEALYGYAAADAMGRNCHDLLATEFPAPLAMIEDELLRRGTWHGELRNRARDGGAIVAESHWVLHRDSAGAPVSVLEFDRDLTEQRRSERRLLELQGEISHMSRLSDMGQMASALAHEINQPLTAATNYVTAARRLLASGDARPLRAASAQSTAPPPKSPAPARSRAACGRLCKEARARSSARHDARHRRGRARSP